MERRLKAAALRRVERRLRAVNDLNDHGATASTTCDAQVSQLPDLAAAVSLRWRFKMNRVPQLLDLAAAVGPKRILNSEGTIAP